MSLIVRRYPGTIGITLDEQGWSDIDKLSAGINATPNHSLTKTGLETTVSEGEKQRYSFNDGHTLIRANQGHLISMGVELEERTLPGILFHGSGEKNVKLATGKD